MKFLYGFIQKQDWDFTFHSVNMKPGAKHCGSGILSFIIFTSDLLVQVRQEESRTATTNPTRSVL